MKDIEVVVEKMARNRRKMAIYFFVKKKLEREIFVFFVITFEPTKIMTCLAPQNDRLNLSLVKYIQVIAQKRPEVVPKWPFSIRKFW